MKNTLLAVSASLALLAGCASTSGPDSDGVTVAFANEQSKAFVAGLQPVKVGLQREGESKKLAAQCNLKSSKYAASSQGWVPATLTCTYEGQTYSKTFNPQNLSRKARNESAAAVGILLCPICGIGMAIGNSANKNTKANDIYGFDELTIKI